MNNIINRGDNMKIGYALKRVFKMDMGRVFKDVSRVSAKSSKNRVLIFFDMIGCAMKYGAGPLDYELFEFYNLKAAKRKTFVTRGVNNALVKKYNSKEYWHIFDNKNEFNETFSEYIARDWLYTKELEEKDFVSFLTEKSEFIYKPIDGTCGKGVEKIDLNNPPSENMFEYIKSKPVGIIEEIVKQNSEMSRIYPLSLNTIRVVTICKDGVVYPLSAFWRIGNSGRFVDNINSGGMAAMIDIKTGEIVSEAADKDDNKYTVHPYTNEQILGFKIPMWDKVIETVSNAAAKLPQIGYVGWDVAISQNSIQLIEGNCFPGHDILQLPTYTKNNTGFKPQIEQFI